ncbi:MAG TPA: aspartate/glutamate/uridylate kinase [Dongiaceae bacterium]
MPAAAGGRQPRLGGAVVVKLGGSLIESPYLSAWLTHLAASQGRTILVAGGGPFADAVRIAQRQRPFADKAAHLMAILAMEQYAVMLAALEPGLRPAASRAAIEASRREGVTPVWLPSRMTTGAADIPESWEVTSDSLGVWLARKLGVSRVLLVKSAALPAGTASVVGLAKAGIVDPLLPRFLAGSAIECRCIEAAGAVDFAAALAAGRLAGTLLGGND